MFRAIKIVGTIVSFLVGSIGTLHRMDKQGQVDPVAVEEESTQMVRNIFEKLLKMAGVTVEVRGYENGMAEVETKNRFQVGDTLEIIHPQGNRQVKLETMFNLDGAPVQVAQGSPVRVRIPLEGPVEGALIARLL